MSRTPAAWGCDHCPGEPIPVPTHPLSKEPFILVEAIKPKRPTVNVSAHETMCLQDLGFMGHNIIC